MDNRSIVRMAVLAAMLAVSSVASAQVDVPALIKSADEAIAQAQSLSSSIPAGPAGEQKVASIEELGIMSALQGYEKYTSQAVFYIESLKGKGVEVTDLITALQTSDNNGMGVLQGLLSRPSFSQPLKDALESALARVKQIEQKLQELTAQ